MHGKGTKLEISCKALTIWLSGGGGWGGGAGFLTNSPGKQAIFCLNPKQIVRVYIQI